MPLIACFFNKLTLVLMNCLFFFFESRTCTWSGRSVLAKGLVGPRRSRWFWPESRTFGCLNKLSLHVAKCKNHPRVLLPAFPLFLFTRWAGSLSQGFRDSVGQPADFLIQGIYCAELGSTQKQFEIFWPQIFKDYFNTSMKFNKRLLRWHLCLWTMK